MTIRLTKRKVKLGLRLTARNPRFVGRTTVRILNRMYHRRGYRLHYNKRGLDVFAQDWDNLILLDACRYEMLEDHPFDGTCTKVTSRGSDTYEFLAGNCTGTDLSDTVYVSASPILSWHYDNIEQNFHDVIFVWEERGWDEENKTVLPSDVRDIALEAAEKYPDKRLFVHFLQPHYPFIGTGTQWDKLQLHDPDDVNPSFWRAIETGLLDVDPTRLWELYEHNLEVALPFAQELVEKLNGKTVVTSDHGNMFKERSFPIPMEEWGHPTGMYTPELVTVPWIECAFDSRRTIVASDPVADARAGEQEELRQRLTDLGYVT